MDIFLEENVRLKGILLILCLSIMLLNTQCTPPSEPDVTPPVVIVLYPYEGSVISGVVNISVTATDENNIRSVWCYLDGENVGRVENTNGAIFELDVSSEADDQIHIIFAAAEDKNSNIGYSDPMSVIISTTDDLVPPVVEIVNPLNGQVVQDSVLVVASADDDRIVREVTFFIDGDSLFSDTVYPYEYFWPVVDYTDSTEHTVFAKAYDGSGNWAVSIPVTVTIFPRSVDRDPPEVTLLYPVENGTLTGTVNVWADVNDNFEVSYVEFYVDGILTSTDHNAPWGFAWDTRAWADGAVHTLYIKAYDTAGNIGTQGPVTFIIN